MTLQNKISRYLQELTTARGRAIIPPVSRVLWSLRLDVPPPLLWPFWAWLILYGPLFGVLMCVFQHILGWHTNHPMGIVRYVISGLFFGVMMAAFQKHQSRKITLSPWYGSPAGNA